MRLLAGHALHLNPSDPSCIESPKSSERLSHLLCLELMLLSDWLDWRHDLGGHTIACS